MVLTTLLELTVPCLDLGVLIYYSSTLRIYIPLIVCDLGGMLSHHSRNVYTSNSNSLNQLLGPECVCQQQWQIQDSVAEVQLEYYNLPLLDVVCYPRDVIRGASLWVSGLDMRAVSRLVHSEQGDYQACSARQTGRMSAGPAGRQGHLVARAATTPRNRLERWGASKDNTANTKHLYNIDTMLVQRLRRLTDVVLMLYKCFVFAYCNNVVSMLSQRSRLWSIGLTTVIFWESLWECFSHRR